jgi:ABC-2 type transport system ATP-binding protein
MLTSAAPAEIRSRAPQASPATEPAIRIDGLTKRFSSRAGIWDVCRGRTRAATTVVDRVAFDVHSGEAFGILGPNGAGKTTIFKMLSTLVLPDGGTACVCGHDIWLEPDLVRGVLASVSSDERSLNWRLSARENLILFAALQGVRRGDAKHIVAKTLELVGLESTGRKMVAAFSSGMRQRLLIARALLSRPRVLLLDEPTRALDPISAEEFRQFLRRELIERKQCTILIATHNADEALGFCDRIAVLNRGRVLATGPAAELNSRFGEERYRVLTDTPDDPAFEHLERNGLLRRLTGSPRRVEGWFAVDCAIPGDPSRTATVLNALLSRGVRVARLERIEPSLADLIGRIIGQHQADGGDA